MAATAQPPDNRQASNNTTTRAAVTVSIILLIIVLGCLTYRFRPKITLSTLARSPYREDIRVEKRIETRYRTLERIPVFQYNSNIQIQHHEMKMEGKAGGKTHEEMGLLLDTMQSRAETKTLATAERGGGGQATIIRTRLSHDPTEVLQSQSSESNLGVGIEGHPPQFPPQFPPQPQPPPPLPILTSTSTQHTNTIAEEEGSATCSICVSHFRAGENIRILPCGNHHIYHRRCIDPWLLDFAWICPLCRTALPIFPTSLNRAVKPPERAHLSG